MALLAMLGIIMGTGRLSREPLGDLVGGRLSVGEQELLGVEDASQGGLASLWQQEDARLPRREGWPRIERRPRTVSAR